MPISQFHQSLLLLAITFICTILAGLRTQYGRPWFSVTVSVYYTYDIYNAPVVASMGGADQLENITMELDTLWNVTFYRNRIRGNLHVDYEFVTSHSGYRTQNIRDYQENLTYADLDARYAWAMGAPESPRATLVNASHVPLFLDNLWSEYPGEQVPIGSGYACEFANHVHVGLEVFSILLNVVIMLGLLWKMKSSTSDPLSGRGFKWTLTILTLLAFIFQLSGTASFVNDPKCAQNLMSNTNQAIQYFQVYMQQSLDLISNTYETTSMTNNEITENNLTSGSAVSLMTGSIVLQLIALTLLGYQLRKKVVVVVPEDDGEVGDGNFQRMSDATGKDDMNKQLNQSGANYDMRTIDNRPSEVTAP